MAITTGRGWNDSTQWGGCHTFHRYPPVSPRSPSREWGGERGGIGGKHEEHRTKHEHDRKDGHRHEGPGPPAIHDEGAEDSADGAKRAEGQTDRGRGRAHGIQAKVSHISV